MAGGLVAVDQPPLSGRKPIDETPLSPTRPLNSLDLARLLLPNAATESADGWNKGSKSATHDRSTRELSPRLCGDEAGAVNAESCTVGSNGPDREPLAGRAGCNELLGPDGHGTAGVVLLMDGHAVDGATAGAVL